MRTREYARWRIAEVLNRLIPWVCWADLAIWAMNPAEHVLWQSCKRSWVCERDRKTQGCCWCGKYSDGGPHV